MNATPPTALVLILVFCAAGMLLTRLARSRRKGGKAVVMDLMYLFLYTFMGGALFFFALTQMTGGEFWWAISFFFLFWGGFAMRAYPIFKGLNSME